MKNAEIETSELICEINVFAPRAKAREKWLFVNEKKSLNQLLVIFLQFEI